MIKSAECNSLLESLSDFVDGTLSEELCEEIEQHIDECQNCHIVVDTVAKDRLSLTCHRQRAG